MTQTDIADRKVCGCAVTIDELRKDICAKVGVDSDIKTWTAEDIGTGKGFLSVMARIKITWMKDDAKLPTSVIAKIPTVDKLKMLLHDDGMKEMFEAFKKEVHKVHNGEISVYETFLACGDTPPTRIPLIYGFRKLDNENSIANNEPAYILMEDLSDTCGHMQLMECGRLNDKQIEQVTHELARVHAWSLTHDTSKIDALNMEQFMDKSLDAFSKSHATFKETLLTDEWKAMLSEEMMTHQDKFLFSADVIKRAWSVHLDNSVPDVLCHGDVHSNNMLFKKDKDGQPTGDLYALIDWQIVNRGNPMQDIARLLHWPVPIEKRTVEFQESMLKVYYASFKEMLGDKLAMPFTFDQLCNAFWKTYMLNGMMLVPMMPSFIAGVRAGQIPVTDADKSAKALLDDTCHTYEQTVKLMETWTI